MSTENYSSFVFWIDEPDRREAVESSIMVKEYFTESIPNCPLVPNRKEVVLLTFDFNKIEYVCLSHSLGNKVTNKATVKFADCIRLESAVDLSQMIQPPKNQILPVRNIGGNHQGARMALSAWNKLVEQVLENNRELKDRILALFLRLDQTSIEDDRVQIYMRRDATNMILRFAGVDPKELLSMELQNDDKFDFQIAVPKEGGEPFMEYDMIVQDQYNFPDWSQINEIGIPRGTVSYKAGNSILRIWNIDHKLQEKKTGVDLIYYHAWFDAFVLVQYKRMEKSGDGWMFRASGDQFVEQMETMLILSRKLRETAPGKFKPKNYRLSVDGFYYKLCSSSQYDTHGTEMIRGMYLPLEYFEGLLSIEDTKGPAGGRIVTYDNVRRHINNSVFIHLVQNGWIGTRSAGTNAFAEIVGNSIRNGREVIYGDYRAIS